MVSYNPDGSLDILLQAKDPGNETQSNWLPIGDGIFHLILRMYLPDQTVFTGNWAAPEILNEQA